MDIEWKMGHNKAPRVLGCEGKYEGFINPRSRLARINPEGSRPHYKQEPASLASLGPNSHRCTGSIFFS